MLFCVWCLAKEVSTMKIFVIVAAFLAAVNVSTCYYLSDQSPYRSSSSGSDYVQYLRQRQQIAKIRTQFESICPDKSDELDEALQKVKECSDGISEDTETACSVVKNHFLRCGRPMISLLEECLPEESKEVPNLVFQAIHSGVGYLCKTDGEHIFELANSCLFKTNYRTVRCERRVKTKLQQYKNKSPTKTDICEFANSMKPCFQNHLKDSCGNQITREAFMGVFDALTSPCKGSTSQIEYNTINEVELLDD